VRILNAYAGIGGNRKLWGDEHEVVAVERDGSVAAAYRKNFPKDTMHVGDAHDYILQHYDEFDFIWASPPCPSHSKARYARHKTTERVYPDMKIYQEIIYLKHHFEGKWVVENTEPYYTPLIPPTKKVGRHFFWANFPIGTIPKEDADIQGITIEEFKNVIGIDITGFKFLQRKDKIMRNCVVPTTGQYILNCAMNILTKQNVKQKSIFDEIP
jgi:DNA (cytosine-5)-methyltransferase 1